MNNVERIKAELKKIMEAIDSLTSEPVSEDYANEVISWEDSHDDWDRVVIRKTAKHFSDWQKQQIMKDAVDGEVTHGKSLAIPSLGYFLDKNGLDFGDKVKLIIIKEDRIWKRANCHIRRS